MNSFNTQAEMDRVKHKYDRLVSLHMFEQSFYPRVNQETLRPLPETPDIADEEWAIFIFMILVVANYGTKELLVAFGTPTCRKFSSGIFSLFMSTVFFFLCMFNIDGTLLATVTFILR